MESWFVAVRQSLRIFRRSPGLAAGVVATLALGIGANTALYSVVRAVLLEPPAYPERSHEIVFLAETSARGSTMGISHLSYHDWIDTMRFAETVAGYRNSTLNWTGRDEPIQARARFASASYFELHGVEPILGRFYTEAEDRHGGERLAVLSHTMWQSQFGADLAVLGSDVVLKDHRYTIVGVLPGGFEERPQERFYLPLGIWGGEDASESRGDHQSLFALARLKPGTTLEMARSQLRAIAAGLEAEYPDTNTSVSAHVQSFDERRTEDFQAIMWALLGATGLVLLVACINVANLLLLRATARRREFAINVALGAGRAQIIGSALSESLGLALAGGLSGLIVAYWTVRIIRAVAPVELPGLANTGLDPNVFGYAFIVAILTGLGCGVVPALSSLRVGIADALKHGGTRGGTEGGRLGRSFLVGEVALVTVLLIAAGLLIRTVHGLTLVDPGFRTEGVLAATLEISSERYTREQREPFFEELTSRVQALPGVTGASVGLALPMEGSNWTSIFLVDDRPAPERADLPVSAFNPVGRDYFDTLGITLIEGRSFGEFDRADSPSVAIVNQSFARRFWPEGGALGKRLKQGWPESVGEFHPWREIVGVVRDVKQDGLDAETRLETYMPLPQTPLGYAHLVVRSELRPLSLVDPVKEIIRELDADLPISDVRTLADVVSQSMSDRRFTMGLLVAFAAVGLLLAAIGIYGVISYSVLQRMREMGLRVALGAQRDSIFRMVLSRALGLAAVGLLVGLAAAPLAGRALAGLLYGVEAWDPVTFAGVPALFALISFLAAAIPARRATRADPLQLLREE